MVSDCDHSSCVVHRQQMLQRTFPPKLLAGYLTKVSKYDQDIHNHKLQTNPRHREEEPQNIYSTDTSVRQ